MSSTYSPDLRIELIGTGDQAGVWGATTNNNLAYVLEQAIAGYVSVAVSSANQAFTYINGGSSGPADNQSVHAAIALTTSTGANFAVYAPPASKQYTIYNASSYVATIYNSTVIGNTTAAGTGVAIPAGRTMTVWSDGTNFAQQNTHLTSPSFTTPALGTPTSGTLTNATGLPLTTGVTGTLPVTNGGTGVTTSTGTGNVVLSNSPTLVTPALGTPASGTLTNATGLPLSTGVTGTLPAGNGGTGAASLAANNVLLGNGTSPVQTVAPGTAGNLLTSNGTTWVSTVPSSVYSGTSAQIFTSSGTFTIPAGITSVKATVLGGGGAGGNASGGSYYLTSGGAAGGLATKYFTGLTPGNTLSVTVGGAGGTSSVASGTETITTVSATGGGNGSQVTSGSTPPTPSGGSASGGSLNTPGYRRQVVNSRPSQGADTQYGTGGLGVEFGTGGNAQGYGAGGGGCSSSSLGCCGWSGNSGGAGAGGLVIFEW